MKPIPDEVLRALTPCYARVYIQTSPTDAYLVPVKSADELALGGELLGCSLGELAAALLELRGAVRGVLRGECCWCDVVAHDAARALLPEEPK